MGDILMTTCPPDFAVMDNEIKSLPWMLVAPHQKQAIKNHGQTLERLHERGGLDIVEVLAILQNSPLTDADPTGARAAVKRIWIERLFPDRRVK